MEVSNRLISELAKETINIEAVRISANVVISSFLNVYILTEQTLRKTRPYTCKFSHPPLVV